MANKYFNRIVVSSASFPAFNAPQVSTGFQGSISLINEGTGTVEYSFNGSTVQGDLVPGTASAEIVFQNTTFNVIWFRLKSGAATSVRIEASDGAMEVGSGGGGQAAPVIVTNFPDPQNVSVTNFPATQPISGAVTVTSGTVTANLGTLNGAATAAKQDTGNASLASLDAKTTVINTGAVVVSSSALPTGASTSANQTTANSSLSSIATSVASIDTKTPALVSGRVPVDGSGVTQPISGSVSVSNFPATQPVSGTVTANLGTLNGAATSALQTTGNTSLSSIDGKITAVNTGAVVVSSSALPTGASTSANQATEIASLASIDSKTPALVSGRQPVDGSGVTQSGIWTVQPGNTANTTPWLNATRFSDTANLDAVTRLRVGNPEVLFDSKQVVDNQPLFWDDQQTTGAGTSSTYLTNQAASQLSVSNATAGTRVRQTFQRFNYQPGKSLLILLTGIFGTGVANVTKRLGYYDNNNGVFFQQLGTTVSIGVRSNASGTPVDTLVAQASWNLDPLNGTGSSGVTLDVTKAQIFVIDFQWGVGRIRFGVMVNGAIVYVHQVLNANVITQVWMSNPNLPLRYEINNSGAGAAASFTQISSVVISEGRREKTGFLLSVDRGATAFAAAAGTSIYPVLAMRLKSAYQMAWIDNLLVSITCASNSTYRWCLLLNPTVTGTALSFTGVTNSAIEAQVNATNATTLSGGTQLVSGYVDATTTQGVMMSPIPDIRLGASIAGTSDVLVLGVQTVVGAAENYFASLTWREQV